MTIEEWLGNYQLGIDIWNKKYRYNNESFDEWVNRISGGDKELKQLILEKKFLFGGRTMANRGTKNKASYFNCYSRGFVEDSYDDIMQAAVDIGLTFKGQGGQGISLSKIRPKDTPIGDEYTSDGIIPFMKIYNEVTAGTSQGGARKGALMLSIDARHKEAKAFIKIKSQEGLIEKANLSLEIDDEFMQAVQDYYEKGITIVLHEKRNYSGHIVKYDVVPIEIFKLLVDNCYDWADPAALFTERFRNYNIMQYDDEYIIETCNPCGEQPLPKHGACCLSSLNLSEFVENPYTSKAYINTEELVHAVKVGIKTLDKLIDENYSRHPLKAQQEMSYNYRNIGLGVFGYATALMKLGFKYGSIEALDFTDQIFGLIFRAAVIESNELAKELGPFPKYKDCVWDSDIIRAHFMQEEIDAMREYGLRNCSLISIAPNGSIATFLNESGGCEPQFALKYTRRTVGMTEGEDTYYDVYCKGAQEYMNINHTNELPDYFVGAQDIPYLERVATQSIMQKHVDTAISSTVNLPNSATKEDIANLYLEAWKQGLKGITIFRDGCKRVGILTTDSKKENKIENTDVEVTRFDYITPVSRKELGTTHGNTYCRHCACGTLYITVNCDDDGNLVETFIESSKGGICKANTAAVNRMVSVALRSGVKVDEIIDQLQGIYCPACAKTSKSVDGLSCPDIMAKTLKAFYYGEEDEKPLKNLVKSKKVVEQEGSKEKCPECGKSLRREGGCVLCSNCGWSKCG